MLRDRAPAAFGLLLAAAVFYSMIAVGKQTDMIGASRYVDVGMALLVPVIAVVTSALNGRLPVAASSRRRVWPCWRS